MGNSNSTVCGVNRKNLERWFLALCAIPLKASTFKVGMYLGHVANIRTLECWHGVQRIADDCRLSNRSVKYARQELQRLGLIEVTHRAGSVCADGRNRTDLIRIRVEAVQQTALPGGAKRNAKGCNGALARGAVAFAHRTGRELLRTDGGAPGKAGAGPGRRTGLPELMEHALRGAIRS